MKTVLRRLCQLLMVVLLSVGQPPVMASSGPARSSPSPAIHPAPAALDQSLQPLGSLLQSDGTLNAPTGFSGSLDPRGWQLVSKPGQPPRFVRASGPVETAAHAGPDAPAAPGDEFWDDRFDVLGVTGYVRAIAVSGSDVYVGGTFSAVGGVTANNVAKWSSTTGTWSALGSGVSGPVYAIAVGGDGVYVGGLFNDAGGVAANNVARWSSTTSTWWALSSGLSNGVSSWVYAIAVSGNDVYVGGLFNGIGGVSSVNANNIAKWNNVTHTWSALGGSVSGYVYAIAANGSDVYVGGLFNAASDAPNTLNIARWNGSAWSALGSGVSGYVYALAVSGADVYVGGLFNAAGGAPNTQNIAHWNGSSWSALGSGASGYVYALAVSGGDVYVGGYFTSAGGVANTNNVAKWNGSGWSALGSGVSGYVYGMALGTDGVYVGGLFNAAGGKASRNFGLWHGTVANPPNPDDVYWDSRFVPGNALFGLEVNALAVSGSDVYVGGSFTTAGGVSANNIAKWDGSTWTALGSGTNGNVSALAVSGSDVYVGGGFTTAGGVSANNIAEWNGSSWSALGSGTDLGVNALAVSGSDVYVGGGFTTAGGVSANNIAKWNGSTWSALGRGTDGLVNALAVSGSDVYVGGNFAQVCGNSACNSGNSTVNHIAKWNGSTWSALGGGLGGLFGYAYAIAVSGSDVYVGGYFTTAGGVSANYIAKWNGSTWSALGSGMNWHVDALVVSGSDVYAAGVFTTAGGVSATYIAKWNGSSWSALGSGTGDVVSALAVSGSDVYVGGIFFRAGGKPSEHFALWHAGPITPGRGSISGRVFDPASHPVPGAPVQVCLTGHGGCYWTGSTDSQGNYLANGLPDGQFNVTANPPAGSDLLPSTLGPLTITGGASLTGQNIHLQANQPPPPGTSISPIEGKHGGIPSLHWKKTLQLYTAGCPGGTASYQILQNGVVIRSGSMTESPPLSGKYQGTIEPLYPHNGYATIHITIQCPDHSTQTRDLAIYIDPSGTVRTIHGTPVMSATVTLSYFNEISGTFTIVPEGDAIMSPANRTNPDLTDAEGHFGWDVIAGYYKVRAEKAGCVSPLNPDQPYVESEILVVPPPVTDLDLRLDCGEKVVFLPLIRR